MTDNQLYEMIKEARDINFQKLELEKYAAELKEQIKQAMKDRKLTSVLVDGVPVTLTMVPRRSLDRGMLLRHGVTPAMLETCTVETESYKLSLVPPGRKSEKEN